MQIALLWSLAIATRLVVAAPLLNGESFEERSATFVKIPLLTAAGEFYGSVSLGTPAKTYALEFDTGSLTTWVEAAGCTNCQMPASSLYTPSASSTSQDMNKAYTQNYLGGDGVKGEYYQDKASFGGLTVSNYVFGGVTTLDAARSSTDPRSGTVGLMIPSATSYDVPFPWMLKKQGLISQTIFAFQLATSSGELAIGAPNPAQYTGGISWVPVADTSGFWHLTFTFIVNGQSVTSSITDLDTGTTIIQGPQDGVDAVHNALSGAQRQTTGKWYIPCTASGNSVQVQFNGVTQTMNWKVLVGPSVGNNLCQSGIKPNTALTTSWIHGQTFLRNQYNIFNADNRTIGFATLSTPP